MSFMLVPPLRLGAARIRCFTRLFATGATPDTSAFIDARNAPDSFDPMSAVVYNAFITDCEGESLVEDITARMRR